MSELSIDHPMWSRFYYFDGDGKRQLKNSTQRDEWDKANAKVQTLKREIEERLSPKNENPYRRYEEEHKAMLDRPLSVTDRSQHKRSAKVFKNLADAWDDNAEKQKRIEKRKNSPDFKRMMENAESIAGSGKTMFPHVSEDALNELVNIANADMDLNEQLKLFWAKRDEMVQANSDAERNIATEAKLQGLAAEQHYLQWQIRAEEAKPND